MSIEALCVGGPNHGEMMASETEVIRVAKPVLTLAEIYGAAMEPQKLTTGEYRHHRLWLDGTPGEFVSIWAWRGWSA